jgi:hypothetical protein
MSFPTENDLSTLVIIPLPEAYLCVECSCITNCSTRCYRCTSTVLQPLAGIVNTPRAVYFSIDEMDLDSEEESELQDFGPNYRD